MIHLPVEQIFSRMLSDAAFDIAEMSLSSYVIRRDRGVEDLLALPIFPSRAFRHSSIYTNIRSGIKSPEDLRGRPVGVTGYQMTAAVWVRGFLSDDYGVNPTEIEWVSGRLDSTPVADQSSVAPTGITIRAAGQGADLERMLVCGEIDALITARLPVLALRDAAVRPLFPNFGELDRERARRERVFPIMHTVVVQRHLLADIPSLPQSLYTAFDAAKQIAAKRLEETSELAVMLPFLHSQLNETKQLLGEDYWPYGLESNRPTLEAFLRYAREQGLVDHVGGVDELFAAVTAV